MGESPSPNYIGLGIALGLMFGTIFGLLTDNLAIGIAIGLPIGVGFGAALGAAGEAFSSIDETQTRTDDSLDIKPVEDHGDDRFD